MGGPQAGEGKRLSSRKGPAVKAGANASAWSKQIGVAAEVKLYSVDDVNETFFVGLLLHAHFDDTSVVEADPDAEDEFVRVPDYHGYLPKLVLVNVVNDGVLDVVVRVNFHTGQIWVAYQGVAHFNESLELQRFPFDRQLFRVAVKSPNAQFDRWRLDTDILDFPDQFSNGKGAVANDAPFLVSCELNTWKMSGINVGIHLDDPDPVSLTKGEFELTIQASRDPVFYLYNYVSVFYIIVLLNAGSVAISVTEIGDRLSFSSSLLLTAVAFKFVLAETLPKVGYQTVMDRYVIMAFLFIAVGSLQHMAASPHVRCFSEFYKLENQALPLAIAECETQVVGEASRFDGVFQLCFAALWTLFNFITALLCYFPRLVQISWKQVINSQVGETDDTIKRTNIVRDLDNEDQTALIV